MQTIKETTLPATLFLVFDDDPETYSCLLTAIDCINTDADTCVLVVDELTSQTTRLRAPYSMLDTRIVHFETGVHLFLDAADAASFAAKFK